MCSWASDQEREAILEAVRDRRPVLAGVRIQKAAGDEFARALAESLTADIARVKAGEQLELPESEQRL